MDISEDPTTADNIAFLEASDRQNELVRAGVSQSGHERNCCFLNTGAERFANISAAAGLDHVGDGRAYTLVDWDHDGDLDLWTTNRTAPRVQFLRNNSSSDRHFLMLKLEGNGTTTNRDAIGARVELVLVGDQRPLIKSLRAGEGFLSQSSKLLHFGLGQHDRIDRVKIRWPGGNVEQFTGLEADRTYRIVQGSDRVEEWSRPGNTVTLHASENEAPPRTDMARIPLRFPIPLPTLQYKTFDGKQVSFDKFHGSPTLVNLWASWCRPCLAELAELREHEQQVRDIGLNVVALSVDSLAEDQEANPEAAQLLLQGQNYPFQSGMADAVLVDQFENVLEFLFDHRRQWTVPTSFLLDKKGHLAAIYVGRVDMDELLSDAKNLGQDEQSWLKASLPFPGRWTDDQRLPDMWPFVAKLFKKNKTADAVDYFTRLEELQAPTDVFPELLVQVGLALREDGDLTAASDRLRQALKIKPENTYVRLQLANVLSRQGRIEEAMQLCREVLRLQPDSVDAHFGLANLLQSQGELEDAIRHFELSVQLMPEVLESRIALGKTYASEKQWNKAIVQFQKATEIEPDAAEPHYQLARALQKIGQPNKAVSSYKRALRLDPENFQIHYSYGTCLMELAELDEAIKHFRDAHRLNPESLATLNGLAWLLATKEQSNENDTTLALNLAQQAAQKTDHSHPQILDTLAAAYAASGNFEKAVSTAQKAIALADKRDAKELADEIRTRLVKYRRGERYRESGKAH